MGNIPERDLNVKGDLFMPQVVSIGHLCVDVTARTVDSMPSGGQLKPVDNIFMSTGGCANNCANDMAKLGMDVGIMGKIGMDSFGDYLVQALAANGVNSEHLIRDPKEPTSASVLLVDSHKERNILHCYGANTQMTEADVDYEALKGAKIVVVNAAFLLPALDGEPMARMLEKIQGMGIYTILDTAWDPHGVWMKAIRPCLPHLDLFIPSIEEAEQIAGKTDPDEIADVFLAGGAKNVVIKMGKEGAFIKNATIREKAPAFVVDAVDTTGAGDSFVAGFTTGLLQGWDLKTCAIFANGVGAHCVMAPGASAGIKPMAEIIRFIQERMPEFNPQ